MQLKTDFEVVSEIHHPKDKTLTLTKAYKAVGGAFTDDIGPSPLLPFLSSLIALPRFLRPRSPRRSLQVLRLLQAGPSPLPPSHLALIFSSHRNTLTSSRNGSKPSSARKAGSYPTTTSRPTSRTSRSSALSCGSK